METSNQEISFVKRGGGHDTGDTGAAVPLHTSGRAELHFSARPLGDSRYEHNETADYVICTSVNILYDFNNELAYLVPLSLVVIKRGHIVIE